MSILFSTEELQQLQPHPQEYVQNKTKYLERMSNLTYSNNIQLPFTSIAKAQHRHLIDQIKYFQYEEKKQLSTDQFNTIFEDQHDNNLQQTQNQDLRKQYYDEFILVPQQEEYSKKQIEKNRYLHICGVINETQITDKNEYKQHLNDIKEIKQELEKITIKKEQKYFPSKEMCRNPALINKVATSMLNMYNVYFKEIFDCLIDEILLEEIVYLNEENLNNKSYDVIQQNEQIQEDDSQIQNNSDLNDLLKQLGNIMEKF